MQAFTKGNGRLNSAYGFDFLYADAADAGAGRSGREAMAGGCRLAKLGVREPRCATGNLALDRRG